MAAFDSISGNRDESTRAQNLAETEGVQENSIKESVAIIDEGLLRDKVYEIRGQKVMLDFDLAEIYGYTTKAFNQQVKRNDDKFEDDFMFQLTQEELMSVRSQNVTSRTSAMFHGQDGGTRYLPHAFTEQGIYMLMTVLRGDLATQQSKALIRLFKRMKDSVEEGRSLVGRREFLDLSLKVSDSLSENISLRRDLSKVEDDVAGIIDDMGDMMRKSDIASFLESFGEAAQRFDFLVLDGHPLEAAAAYAEIYEQARESVLVVDNYVGVRTLEMLSNVRDGVSVTLFTDNKGSRLHLADIAAFESEHPGVPLEIRSGGGFVHDRFIALDYGTPSEAIYHCGASSKDAGARATAIMRFGNAGELHALFDRLLEQPPLDIP